MKQLSTFPDDAKFYRGTIIVLKGINKTPKGIFDSRYCMVGNASYDFLMLDVHRSMGSCILHNLTPNIPGHVAVDKNAIKLWVERYIHNFYDDGAFTEWLAKIDDNIFIENLEDYFTQTDRDLFL